MAVDNRKQQDEKRIEPEAGATIGGTRHADWLTGILMRILDALSESITSIKATQERDRARFQKQLEESEKQLCDQFHRHIDQHAEELSQEVYKLQKRVAVLERSRDVAFEIEAQRRLGLGKVKT